MKPKIKKWISYELAVEGLNSKRYTEDPGNDSYAETVVEYFRDNPERKFSGTEHQYCSDGAPVFDDGRVLLCSMRQWGRLMARAEGDNDPMAYCDWAWGPLPDDFSDKGGSC